MSATELRYKLISIFLQASKPLSLAELASQSGTDEKAVRESLTELLREHLIVSGNLSREMPPPQYFWAARWAEQAGQGTASAKTGLEARVESASKGPESDLDVNSQPARAFHNFIINEYVPPTDKRFLVFFQCSVRRPFSTSPSHVTMRRAVSVATGYDPSHEFELCPVHVVVMASTIGPVPYELEDTYPANVRGGGVKGFKPDVYERVKPVLATRIGQYIQRHGRRYEHMASFTEGRYADVMAIAAKIVGARVAIFPDENGKKIVRTERGKAPPKYWDKYWIQLCLEIMSWLDKDARNKARSRLEEMGIEYK